ITPEECATIRSIARCVLPVLVGPSTAVTPAPGARSCADGEENDEKAIFIGFLSRCDGGVCHNATRLSPLFKLRNESGTNRARIGDSLPVLIRSPQHLGLTAPCSTRSSLDASDKRRETVEFP